MRVRRALLLGTLLLAACREEGNQSSAEAARADSSAAGYNVGSTGTIPAADSTHPARPESVAVASRPDSTRTPPVGRDSAHAAVVRRDTTHLAKRDSTGRKTQAATVAKTTRAVTKVATKAAPPDTAAPSGPVRVSEFLTYDAKARIASVQLVAGYNGVNGSLNYNGATRGGRVLAIPLGWHVHVTVTNRDSDLQHSAIVVPAVLPPPLELTTPAFEGGALPRLDEGLHEDETGTLDFIASRAGRYMLACGVPGHAQSGMWIQLLVTTSITAPAYR